MPMQVLKPKFHIEECLEEIRQCLSSGWTGLGFKTVEFEEAWKRYTGLANAHFLNSATSGLHLAVNILKKKHGWSDGDEVITTPLTFVSTNHVLLYERLAPVFADIDESLCLAPESIEERLTSKTRAVMYVGMGGNTGRLNEVRDLCARHGLSLILDAAHMSGTRYLGRHVGTEAEAAVFSFQAVKNLPTADSGMVCFRDAEDDAKARQLAWMGITKDTFQRSNQGTYRWRYDVADVGFKYHGNSIMAAIALVQLKYLDEDNARRRHLVAQYKQALQQTAGVSFVPEAAGCNSSYHLLQARVKERDRVIEDLYSSEVYPGVHYIDNTQYAMYSYAQGTCPEAQHASEELISLPLHLELAPEDVDRVCKALQSAVSARA